MARVPLIGMTTTEATMNEYEYEMDTEHGIPDDFDMCVNCGVRPWGFGYCGEECRQCGAESV